MIEAPSPEKGGGAACLALTPHEARKARNRSKRVGFFSVRLIGSPAAENAILTET
jgi:hypothetical protein